MSFSDSNSDRLFEEYERPFRVQNAKVCCIIAGFFMPAGFVLDQVMYGTSVMLSFLPHRLACSLFLAIIWWILYLRPQTKYYRIYGHLVALLPVLFISWMIYVTEGPSSTYYAGLNLVNLGSVILLRWTLGDSIFIILITLAAYLLATLARGPIDNFGLYFNNIYFLTVTGVFIVAGSWLYNNLRRSEFRLRHSLDRNRAELESSNHKLRELDELKSRFFANVSHELRTPLTLMVAPIETLLYREGSLRSAEDTNLLETMHGNAMRLLKLINDLLDLVRLEAGRATVERERVNVDEFIHGISNAVSSLACDKRVQLQVDVAASIGVVMIDAEKLERICLNLLFNAIKFTAAGGSVSVIATEDAEWLTLLIVDSGMGISPEQLPHIFNRFWQADTSAKRKFQGMGIGLALVKELIEVQSGTVSAVSEVGKGTEITVKLPLIKPGQLVITPSDSTPETAFAIILPDTDSIDTLYRRAEMYPAMTSLMATIRPVETAASKSGKPMLLIADDEPDMLRFLKGQLSSEYEILEAVDGQQALEKALQFMPDIILSDMMMPEKDGLQVCRELRERTSTKSIPIVLLTARADERTKLDCLGAGASDFLSKPFSMIEIKVRLKNLVQNFLYQKQLAVQKLQLESALEELKDTEALLVQNEKMVSLGRLSAGLIHEINNPLNYVRQGLHLIDRTSKHLPESFQEDFNDTVKDVQEGVDRVVQIISDLRGFTRSTDEQSQIVDLNVMVETGMRFFSHVWKDGVTHNVHLESDLLVTGDSNQFMQVFINLIQNAVDAVTSSPLPGARHPHLEISGTHQKNEVIFSIRDNGVGIPEDIRTRIFDPFFTTKDVGQGMGLGLAICNRIISEHSGRVELRSEVGQYTEFILSFPHYEISPQR